MNGGGVTPRPTPPTPQQLYTIGLISNGLLRQFVCDEKGRLAWFVEDESTFILYSSQKNEGWVNTDPIEGYPLMPTAMQFSNDVITYGNYTWTWDDDHDVYEGPTNLQPLQRPLYSHEYTYGNFITNGERNQSNNMKAAYITIGGTVQVFKENSTAGKWVTSPNDNNLALMDAPLTSFEAGLPSDFTYQGFTFTFEQGDVDGYIVTPALSII